MEYDIETDLHWCELTQQWLTQDEVYRNEQMYLFSRIR